METLRNAGYTKPGDECNCLSLIRLKFPRFLPRIKAKTLSSICNVPKDSNKDKKCFSFIEWGIAKNGCGYMKKVGPVRNRPDSSIRLCFDALKAVC